MNGRAATALVGERDGASEYAASVATAPRGR